jgi:hypothetical protein
MRAPFRDEFYWRVVARLGREYHPMIFRVRYSMDQRLIRSLRPQHQTQLPDRQSGTIQSSDCGLVPDRLSYQDRVIADLASSPFIYSS